MFSLTDYTFAKTLVDAHQRELRASGGAGRHARRHRRGRRSADTRTGRRG